VDPVAFEGAARRLGRRHERAWKYPQPAPAFSSPASTSVTTQCAPVGSSHTADTATARGGVCGADEELDTEAPNAEVRRPSASDPMPATDDGDEDPRPE
jgi:hypothetical protein